MRKHHIQGEQHSTVSKEGGLCTHPAHRAEPSLLYVGNFRHCTKRDSGIGQHASSFHNSYVTFWYSFSANMTYLKLQNLLGDMVVVTQKCLSEEEIAFYFEILR